MKLTKLRLNKAISSITRPLIKASNFDDVLKFFNEVESEFDWWYDELIDNLGFSTEDDFEDVVLHSPAFSELFNYTDSVESAFLQIYLEPYIEDALDKFPEAYSFPEDNTIYCTVCGKPMQYWGDDSVMLTDENWEKVLDFYNLTEYEEQARERSRKWYDMCDRRGHLRLDAPRNCHTYICNECIEKALGHPIYREDINSSPFNLSYIKSHFGPDGDSNITEDYFDNVDLKLDIGEFTGNEESEFPVCDMPTHKFFFEINTTLYKLFGLKKTYDMMKRCIKKLMIYLDASRNVYSYGNFKFISSSYGVTFEQLKKLLNDEFNSNNFKDMFDPTAGGVCGFIAFDINAKFNNPVASRKFISFLRNLSWVDNEIVYSTANVFSPPDSEVEFSAKVRTQYGRPCSITDERIDVDFLKFMSALCKPNMMAQVALSSLSVYSTKEMFCKIVLQSLEVLGNSIRRRDDVNPDDYATILVWTGFPLKHVGLYDKDKKEGRYNTRLYTEKESHEIITKAVLFVEDKHSGMTAYIGETEDTATNRYFLLDDCFILDNKVFGVVMMNIPSKDKTEFIVN